MVAGLTALFAGMKLFDWILIATTLIPVISAALAKLFGLGVGSANRGEPSSEDGSTEKSGSGWLSKLGIIGSIIGALFFSKGWLAKFPTWFKGLFATGGSLFFVRKFVMRAIYVFRHPIIVVITLLISSIFPSILEYFFLIVGFLGVKIMMFFFHIGKRMFMNDGNEHMNELRTQLVNSVDGIPLCMKEVMSYLHVVEDLGILITTFTLLIAFAAFKAVYENFVVRPLGHFVG